MTRLTRIVVSLAVISIGSLLLWIPLTEAQTTQVLDNEKVIALVRMGLSEALIVAKIRKSGCECDTSVDAIAKLKAARVSDNIIMTMLDNAGSNRNRNEQEVQLSSDASPRTSETNESATSRELRQLSEPGIYFFDGGNMQYIEPSVFSGGKVNPLWGTLTYGIKKTKWKAKVRGKSANLQTGDSRPVFYFVFSPELRNSGATMAGLWGFATSPNEFVLVQMGVKTNSREAVLGEYGAWTGAEMGARDEDIREYSFEKIKPGIYKVEPKADLVTGEYCFYYAGTISGFGFAGGKIFDFGVK